MTTPRLSIIVLHRQFLRFKEQVFQKSGEPFRSFNEGEPHRSEGYKAEIYREASERLSCHKWTEQAIGSGEILGSAMPHVSGADLLSFQSSNPKQYALLWFDSEQCPDDHWHQIDRAMRRAGLTKPPPWFYAYCLTGLGWQRGWNKVMEDLRVAAAKHGGVHSMLLDGVADFVADVNDAEESNAYVAMLQTLAIRHDCPTIGVIHFNPGGEKTRGHLGSQMERKAETNLRLDKSDDERTVSHR